MKNLMNYLTEYADITFAEYPFSAVDALVLCQVTYPKMDDIVPANEFVSWSQIIGHPESEKLYTDRLFGSMYREFMKNVSTSSRYAGIEVGLFRETVSVQDEVQFAAVTFRIKDMVTRTDLLERGGVLPHQSGSTTYFIAFRGTDEKVIGWKEDFNIGHLDVVPSQRLALEYLNSVGAICEDVCGEKEPDRKNNETCTAHIMVGGHSKGGSQAVYAAAKADVAIKSRITGVFSFDGFGLGDEFYESADFAEIRPVLTKIIPDSSIIGTLFENRENCRIVRSDASGFKQHDFMNWHVEDGEFVYLERLRRRAEKNAIKLRRWIASLNIDERERFVEIIYGLILACSPENIYNMSDKMLAKAMTIIEEIRDLEAEEKKELKRVIRKLFSA